MTFAKIFLFFSALGAALHAMQSDDSEKNPATFLIQHRYKSEELMGDLLQLSSSSAKKIHLTIKKTHFDKKTFRKLLSILQEEEKIVALNIEDGADIVNCPTPKSMPMVKIGLRHLHFRGVSGNNSFLKLCSRDLFPFLNSLVEVSVKDTPNSFDLEEIISEVLKHPNNKTLLHLDISDNRQSLDQVSVCLNKVMKTYDIALKTFIARSNDRPVSAKYSKNKSYEKEQIEECWISTLPIKLGPSLEHLDLSQMKLSDEFAAMILGMFKDGHLKKLRYLNLSGINDSQPKHTAKMLIDIAKGENFYAMQSLIFDSHFLVSYNNFIFRTEKPMPTLAEEPQNLILKLQPHSCHLEKCRDFNLDETALKGLLTSINQMLADEKITTLTIKQFSFNDTTMELVLGTIMDKNLQHVVFENCSLDINNQEDFVSLVEKISLEMLTFKNTASGKELVMLLERIKNNGHISKIKNLKIIELR